MNLDLKKFFHATNPGRTLFVDNKQEDYQFYIDLSSVRGGQIIDDLKDNITLWHTDEAYCQLFTGHIGCGKSTELLRLKAELETNGFHVVYFDSSQDLEMGDVDVSDIFLAIARHVSESLDQLIHSQPKTIKDIITLVSKLLQTEIELTAETEIGKISATSQGKLSFEVGIPGIGKVSLDQEEGISLVAPLIGKINAKAKASPNLRNKLRGYLEPRTSSILEAINQELLEPGIIQLKQLGKKGLVVIVDSLDKIDNTPKSWGRSQQEYLFVDRGEQLRSLNCHLVYTMPLGLRFSNDFNTLKQRFLTTPLVLPMVSLKLRDQSPCPIGMQLLREMILARAFPDLPPAERVTKITEIFDTEETLEHLCAMSGGHVRELLRLLNDSLKKQKGLPISRHTIEKVIAIYRNDQRLSVDENEWNLLRRVSQEKKVAGEQEYQTLIRSMFVYEYHHSEDPESWFDVNPILATAKELQT
ncbi:MAG: ATP-binding protein [Cyanobacteria bacterium P01_F01_bin.143]